MTHLSCQNNFYTTPVKYSTGGIFVLKNPYFQKLLTQMPESGTTTTF